MPHTYSTSESLVGRTPRSARVPLDPPPRRILPLALFLWIILTLSAAAGVVAGPFLGFVPDPSGHALRPIRGIPGAATWGDLLNLGDGVSTLALAPRRDAALLLTSAGVRIAAFAIGQAPALSDPGLPPDFHPTLTAFSPDGTNAALYDGSALWVAGAAAASRFDLSMLPGSISSLAVSDGVQPLIAGTRAGGAQDVFVLDSQGGYRLISSFHTVTAITFAGRSRDLAVADRGAGRLLLIRDPLSGNAPEILLDRRRPAANTSRSPLAEQHAPEGLIPFAPEGPLDVSSSADGKTLAVVATSSAVGLFDLSTRRFAALPCNCAGVALVPLHGNAIFRLSGSPDRPLWILDGDAPQPRTVFVPAAEAQP